MPQPTSSQVHVDRPLSNISIAFMQDAAGFVSDKVFPLVPVAKQSDRYYQYDRRQWKRSQAKVRAPSTESAGSGFDIDSSPTYFCPVVGFHKDVDDQLRANADDPINVDRDATEFVSTQLLLKREIDWSNRYFQPGVWSNQRQGVAGVPVAPQFRQWNEGASTPVKDVRDAGTAMKRLTGFRPNKLVISPDVEDALSEHPDILDRIKYTEKGIVTLDLLAALFRVQEVLVADGIQDTSAEGAAVELSDFIMGKHALLVYANPSPGLLKPSAGYTFGWTGLLAGSSYSARIKRFRMEPIESDRIEGETAYDQKVVAPDLGFFFKDAVA